MNHHTRIQRKSHLMLVDSSAACDDEWGRMGTSAETRPLDTVRPPLEENQNRLSSEQPVFADSFNRRCRSGRPTFVFEADLYRFPVPNEEILQELFDLTPAEARLAQIIARGETLSLAAHTLGIKMPTARSQLSAVFAKTKTRRQAQLVALLCRLAHLKE